MPLEEVSFTSLAAREQDNLLPFSVALEASDCFTDTDAVVGRNGTRLAMASTIAGTKQHMGRFRPDLASARTVLVVAGQVWVVADPTSTLGSDGAATSLGTPFTTTAVVSGAALGKSYYLSTDQSSVAWVRINWTSPDTYTLETLSSILQGAQPTANTSTSVGWTLFRTITPTVSGCVSQDNTKAGFTSMNADWRGFAKTDGGNNDPDSGSSAQYKLAADFDASGFDWVAIGVSPHDGGGTATQFTVTVQVAIDVAGSPSDYYSIGSIYDVPPVADSPNLLYCDLRGVTSSVKSKIRYIKFLLEGSSGGKFIVYGYLFLPAPQVANPGTFYVDFYNSSTGQASPLTTALNVNMPPPYLPSYPDSRMGNSVAHSSGALDQMLDVSNQRIFNRQAGVAMPDLSDIGPYVTISGNAPAFASPATLTARLWEDTDNGRRLVDSKSVATGAAYTFYVKGGTALLANDLYKPGGPPPRAQCLAAHAQRLIAMYQNRVYISSYVPTSDNTNPYPQWPDIAVEDSDGWSFDITPSPSEAGQVLNGQGDALYIASEQSWWFMSDLTPNSPPFQVFKRGALGHFAAGYFEDRFFVAAWDGIYMGVGRSDPQELTEPIRRIYQDWLAPNETVVIGYDQASRSLFVFQGFQVQVGVTIFFRARYLRYRFPIGGRPGRWTRGTLNTSVSMCASWWGVIHYDASTPIYVPEPEFWMMTSNGKLVKWQTTATRDEMSGIDTTTGTAIPDWVYSTGFDFTPGPSLVKGVLVDATATVSVKEAKTAAGSTADEARLWYQEPAPNQDEAWKPGSANLKAQKFRLEFSGPNNVTLRRAAWEREAITAKGG